MAALRRIFNKSKSHIWRGHPERALITLNEIDAVMKIQTEKIKLVKLMTYREKYIVNSRERYQQGLIFTSQLAESNVESLINQRCKKQQHVRWTQESLYPLLQIRTVVARNNWSYIEK